MMYSPKMPPYHPIMIVTTKR